MGVAWSGLRGRGGIVSRLLTKCAAIAAASILATGAFAQMMPGGPGGPGGMPGGMPGGGVPGGAGPSSMGGAPDDTTASSSSVKPDVAAMKAYKEAMKYLGKAKEYEASAAAASNPDKRAREMEKVGDAYSRALDEFTEALSNKGDMVEAWDNVGYVHLRLGAYREAIDDYDHALALNADLMDAVEHRAEAYLAVDRIFDVQPAYMNLYNHAPDLAARLMTAMQKWYGDHQADPKGMQSSDVAAFGKWLAERDGIAKQTASLPH